MDIENLKQQLRDGVVEIKFTKVSGEETTIQATLNEGFMPATESESVFDLQRKRNAKVLERLKEQFGPGLKPDNISDPFVGAEFLEKVLDKMVENDPNVFGTEQQRDPRGDMREGAWSMYCVEGVDTSKKARKPNPDVLNFYSIDRQGWRSCRIDSIISFEEQND